MDDFKYRFIDQPGKVDMTGGPAARRPSRPSSPPASTITA